MRVIVYARKIKCTVLVFSQFQTSVPIEIAEAATGAVF